MNMWNIAKNIAPIPNIPLKTPLDVIRDKLSSKKKDEETEDDDDISVQLTPEKEWIEYKVLIFKVQGITHQIGNTCISALVKSRNLEINSYVKVTFGNLTGKTSVQKGTNDPVWDQQLSFIQSFPPESGILKFQLIHSNFINRAVIALHTIDLADISKDGNQGYLPTFGPCLVHLYGSETGNSSENPEDSSSYKGSLLLAILTQAIDSLDIPAAEVKMDSISSSESLLAEIDYWGESFEGITEEFLLFGSVFEVSMINKKLGKSTVALELSIGNSHFGDIEDTSFIPTSIPPVQPIALNKDYMFLPSEDIIPCLGGCCVFPDQRKRSFFSNCLDFICSNLRCNLTVVEDLISRENESVKEKLEQTLTQCICEIQKFLPTVHENHAHTTKNTLLDKQRIAFTYNEMQDILCSCSKWVEEIWEKDAKKSRLYASEILQRIENLVEDPQHALPDIFIWMTIRGQRVAFKRILARHILFSTVAEEAGKDYGKKLTLFLKLHPDKRKTKFSNVVHAKVVIFLWLGLMVEKKHVLEKLPGGYCSTPSVQRIADLKRPLPTDIHYTEVHEFKLRAYVYQARALLAADVTGLSDPYVRIVFFNKFRATQIIEENLNPTWNELLIFQLVSICGDAQYTKQYPPCLVIEVYDYNALRDSKLIGTALVRPEVKLNCDRNSAIPVLQWHKLSRCNAEHSGDILLALQLEQISLPTAYIRASTEAENKPSETGILKIPEEIRPKLSTYRLEVVFWGLRNLKKLRLRTIKRPRVDIECGDQVLHSTVAQYKIHQNFLQPVAHIDIQLPEQDIYRPPLTICVVECGKFGVSSIVGVHIIKSLKKYFHENDSDVSEVKDNGKHEWQELDNISFRSTNTVRVSKHTIVDFERRRSKIITERRLSSLRDENVDSDVKEEEEEYRDWWTRYFKSQVDPQEGVQSVQLSGSLQSSQGQNLRGSDPRLSLSSATRRLTQDNQTRISVSGPHGDHSFKNHLTSPLSEVYERRTFQRESLIKIYPCELEEVSEFGGFSEWLHSFNLFRGKQEGLAFDDEKRKVGFFKGSFKIYKVPLPLGVHDPYLPPTHNSNTYYFNNIPNSGTIQVLLKVYIVKAINLHPQDANNKVDPYIVVRLGTKRISDKENYISKQINPIFGKCFTFESIFPRDSLLTVQIYDWDLMGADDLVGETKIDLENRLYSRHRPLCGIPQKYELTGHNAWRDIAKPKSILTDLCQKWNFDGPHFFPDAIRIKDHVFSFPGPYIESENEDKKEIMSLEVLRKWEEIAGFSLIPEHIETRSLYHPLKSEEQGKLEMWIDMFFIPISKLPPERDIAPRKPISYELRVTIWNTDDVILADDSVVTGEQSSDIYVKGWLADGQDEQRTDVHYGSQTGEGNFNWRFVFPFDYLPADRQILATRKESMFSWDQTEIKMDSNLNLQVWDADHFSADDFLGSVSLNLNHIPRGAKNSDHCSLHMLEKGSVVPDISIFKQPRMKGWWPVFDENGNGEKKLTGKIEMELHLLPKEDAEVNPVGRGRKEPEPLEKPQRPASSISGMFNPMKAFRFVVWRRYKRTIIKAFLMTALILLLLLFLYNMPGYLVKKMLGV